MRINGKEILNLPISKDVNGKYTNEFEIVSDKNLFYIEINEETILKFYVLNVLEREKVHADYLMGIDQDGVEFTLYDCYIFLDKLPAARLWIKWTRLLYGEHIEHDKSEKVKCGEYVIELPSSSVTYRSFVGKSRFCIFEGQVCVSTEWNEKDEKFNGIKISVECKEACTLEGIEKIVLRLMEIYFLEVGFFAEVLQRKIMTETGKTIFYYENFAAYARVTKRNINLPHALELRKDTNYSKIFMKWWEIREKEVATFNLFAYTVSDLDYILEVPTATYIQCLEGYFRVHHNQEMKKFSDESKEKIINYILESMNQKSEILNICQEYEIDMENIEHSIKGLLGNLNNRSLGDILIYAMKYSNASRKLFEYECNTFINNKKTIWKVFLAKAVGHRNWLSHMGKTKTHFHDEEIELASSKLKLLFRLSLLQDIEAEVTEYSLDRVIQRINNWYNKYSLK